MNYLIITIDALSKWYIDKMKKNTFFEYLENNTYCYNNMFSLGPCTDAAVRGFWAGDKPLSGYSYMCQQIFKSDTFFKLFEKTHYMYYGEFILYADYEQRVDNHMKRENFEDKGFYVTWLNRIKKIKYYSEDDFGEVEFILDCFFESYKKVAVINEEKKKYERNKREYINDIMQLEENSSFYKNIKNDYIDVNLYKNITNIRNQKKHELSNSEALFIKKAKNKNIEFAINNKNNNISDVEKIIGIESNRCIFSNNDLLGHMRDEYETFPKLREEIEHFLDWYDNCGEYLDKPFFAYIHNMDFHYPENFMNSRVDDIYKYENEIEQLIDTLDTLENPTISVSKQLSIKMIEKNLEYLWEELEKRKVFDNTCVVVTADHGMPNMMNPVSLSNSRWSGTRVNLNIPMYIKAPNLITQIDNRLESSEVFKLLLLKINEGNYIESFAPKCKKKYFFTSWINTMPDIKRNELKVTIRDDNWSITCNGFYYQTFSSLHIMSIYNLCEDNDEIHNIPYIRAKNDERFINLMKSLGQEWYALLSELYYDKLFLKSIKKPENYQCVLSDYKEKICADNRISKDEFNERVSGKNMIVFFDDVELAKEMLFVLPDDCNLIEIWTDNTDIRQICGHRCIPPHKITEGIEFVVCSKNEILAMSKIKKFKIKNYILWKNVMGKFKGL